MATTLQQITALNTGDYIIIGIIAFSVLVSVIRGFVREALSLVTWIVAFWAALNFYHPLAEKLKYYIVTPSVQLGVAFLAILVVVLK